MPSEEYIRDLQSQASHNYDTGYNHGYEEGYKKGLIDAISDCTKKIRTLRESMESNLQEDRSYD